MNSSSHKRVTLICTDTASDLETIALRGVLEYFNFVVSTHWIGNKTQFLGLLQGDEPVDDMVVILAHGDEGLFHMPTEETVHFEELHIQLPGKTVISTGCASAGAATEFINGGCRLYIAPKEFPEGNDAAFFLMKFFWLLAQGKNAEEAFIISSKDMQKGSEFLMQSTVRNIV